MSVRLEKEGGVGVIVLDKPPANSYDYTFLREFASAIDDARIDLSIKSAIVVTSASERFFSAGADVAVFAGGSPRSRFMLALLAHETFRKMENTPLVFIAAIAGHCLGGGLELALACDLRFASEGAYQIGLPEVNLGLFPGSGGTQRLPRLVGRGIALDMLISGETIDAAEAHRIGLVNHIAPAGELLEFCRAWLRKVLANGPKAVALAMEAVDVGLDSGLDQGLRFEAAAFGLTAATDDRREGTRAFLEKRPAQFRGK